MAIQKSVKATGVKPSKSFDSFLGPTGIGGIADAFGGAAVTAGQLYGGTNAQTVLSSAFSGISSLNAMGANSYSSLKYSGSYMPSGIPGGGSSAVVPGTEGFSQWDLINTMNQNNLQLLELQATMQSNMQGWNTKSNILSADHRARMAMIEKFTARG